MSHQKGGNGNTLVYPVTQAQIDALTDSRFASPRVGNNHGFKCPDSFDYEESLKDVLAARLDVVQNKYPRWFMQKNWCFDFDLPADLPQPLLDQNLSLRYPKGLADVVHMDLPTQMPAAVLRYLLKTGANVTDKNPNYVNFLNTVPRSIKNYTVAIHDALEKAFEVKYYYGMTRPEVKFATGGDTYGEAMTAYAEGCPTHPTLPAGHGAAAGGGVASLLNDFDVSQEQKEVALTSAYIWAQARLLAGVHYSEDNILGLLVGGLGQYMTPSIVAKYTI